MGEEFVEEGGGFFEEVFGAVAGGIPRLGWGLRGGPGDDADSGLGRGGFLVEEAASSGVWAEGEDVDDEGLGLGLGLGLGWGWGWGWGLGWGEIV